MKILAVVCLACVGSSYCHAWGGSPQDNDWKVARVVVGWLPGRTVGDASYIFRARIRVFSGLTLGLTARWALVLYSETMASKPMCASMLM